MCLSSYTVELNRPAAGSTIAKVTATSCRRTILDQSNLYKESVLYVQQHGNSSAGDACCVGWSPPGPTWAEEVELTSRLSVLLVISSSLIYIHRTLH